VLPTRKKGGGSWDNLLNGRRSGTLVYKVGSRLVRGRFARLVAQEGCVEGGGENR